MTGHHLILGKTFDYLTGAEIEDNHDERYRQKIARLLVEEKGFSKSEIKAKIKINLESASGRKGYIWLDFSISLKDKILMIIKYGPGSIVTRQTPAIALSRLMAPYQIPFVVVTNGEEALVMDGESGAHISSGIDSIPDRINLEKKLESYYFPEIRERSLKMAKSLVYAYEIDGACPCDDNVCRLPEENNDRNDAR